MMQQPGRYRTKPVTVTIASIQFTGSNEKAVLEFMSGAGWAATADWPAIGMMTTHGDEAFARPGDWVIPEQQKGRFYPCSAADFDRKYESAAAVDDMVARAG